MNAHPMQFVAKHKVPFMIAGGAIVLLLVYKNMSGGSSASTTSDSSTATDATSQQIALIGAQAGAALQAQQDKEQFQLAYGSQQGGISTVQQTNQLNAQLALADIQKQQVEQQTASQLALGMAETNANVQIQNIIAGENLGIAQVNGQTQQVISTNSSNVNIAQAQAMQAVGEANANAAASQGGNSMGGIIGAVGSIAAMFL